MYNIYSEEKKQENIAKKITENKNYLLSLQKHKEITNNLARNYQKRVRKFIVDVRYKPLLLLLLLMI